MTVTKIEPVTKTRYKIYIDGQFAFVLYKGELSRYHIEPDAQIDAETYQSIKETVILKRAKLRAMHLLTDMGRTEAQLRTKLIQSGYPEDITEQAVQYVKSFGYINDAEYARSFILSRKDKKSRREIYAQLSQKGLSEDVIEQAFEECYGDEDTENAIISILEKKHYDPEHTDEYTTQKLMAHLARKGFGYQDIKHVMLDIFHKTV